MKSILVTGGTGFIGSHTSLNLLENGYRVIILDSFHNSSHVVIDRIKITFKNNEWILVRLSGTEPVARIYAESNNKHSLDLLISKFNELFIQ